MEWGLPGVEVRGQEEVEGEEVEAGWGEHAPELGPAGIASALSVGLGFLTK